VSVTIEYEIDSVLLEEIFHVSSVTIRTSRVVCRAFEKVRPWFHSMPRHSSEDNVPVNHLMTDDDNPRSSAADLLVPLKVLQHPLVLI